MNSNSYRDDDGSMHFALNFDDRTIKVQTHQNGTGSLESHNFKQVCPCCEEPDCYADCDESQMGEQEAKRCGYAYELQEGINNRRVFNASIDGMESLILSAACAGTDIGSNAFMTAIQTAYDAICHHHED